MPEPTGYEEEERRIINAASAVLGNHVMGAMIFSTPPGYASRVITILFALTPWRVPEFHRRHAQIVAAVEAEVRELALIEVKRLPFREAFKVGLLQWLYRRRQRT